MNAITATGLTKRYGAKAAVGLVMVFHGLGR